jgi:hypothetical protein
LNPDPIPVGDLSSIVDVFVDAGSGLDGIVLDVEHVSLQEVLSSVFVMGVGALSLLVVFPVGALEMQQAVHDSRTAPGVTTVSLMQQGLSLDIDISSGRSDDLIDVGIGSETDPTADGSVRFSAFTGDGDDDVLLVVPEFGYATFAIDLGAGHDSANLIVGRGVHPDPTGKVRELTLNLLGGSGDDVLLVDINANSTDYISVDCDGGSGNDLIRIDYREGAFSGLPRRRGHIHVRGGDGNDFLVLQVATQWPRSFLDLLVDGGDGFDIYWVSPNVWVIYCELNWQSSPR